MIPASFFQISDRSNWDKTNIILGKWRIVVAFLLGLSYFTFYSRGAEWIVYWMGWLIYAALWLPLQGRHTGEKPNLWTYFFIVGDVLLFILAANIEHNILNNYSAVLILPLFQYLLRYGRKAATHYFWVSLAAIGYICLIHYQIHPVNHFVVAAVMYLLTKNEGLLVQENMELRKQLTNMAIYDELTGLYNFRFFNEALEREISRAGRYGHELTLLLIDIDFFKKINDTYGHQKGNEVLKRLADIISDAVRESDYAARFGGEEFVIILPQTSLSGGIELAERVRMNIAAHQFDFGHVTVSIGISTYPSPSPCKDKIIIHADKAMYAAKDKGKNRVEINVMDK